MKTILTTAILLLTLSVLFAEAPIVTNVTASQRTDGSKIIDITYDVSDAENDELWIDILFSADGGVTFDVEPSEENLTGDFGEGITPGTGKSITWNIGNESTTFDANQCQIRVTADDEEPNQSPEGFVFVEGGTFQMGDRHDNMSSALPLHDVTLDDFYMGVTEVTNQQVIDVFNWANSQGYLNCSTSTVTNAQGNSQELLDMNDSDCAIDWNGSSLIFGGSSTASTADCPCIEITWYGSIAYANYLSLQEGLSEFYNLSDWSCNWNANGYRLPTEAEWEYAARGGINEGDNYRYSGCHNESDLPDYGWYSSNSGSQTHSVGTKLPNQLGLCDMSGNVYEWCWDWYDSYSSSSQTNPTGANSGSYRVIRGGRWSRGANYLRVANRNSNGPSNGGDGLGFRLLRSSN